ncbi:hypothetical protein L6164_013691 [Bauhinia variegata]|uniref:Uncharacterized protein n=1 Tax=Bauhinia variegata TaxID=167791 RepID=A0ACB9NFR3_BAUVA|nr:hypothetical protein L6164_013691 [Bauhinia variegata]
MLNLLRFYLCLLLTPSSQPDLVEKVEEETGRNRNEAQNIDQNCYCGNIYTDLLFLVRVHIQTRPLTINSSWVPITVYICLQNVTQMSRSYSLTFFNGLARLHWKPTSPISVSG